MGIRQRKRDDFYSSMSLLNDGTRDQTSVSSSFDQVRNGTDIADSLPMDRRKLIVKIAFNFCACWTVRLGTIEMAPFKVG